MTLPAPVRAMCGVYFAFAMPIAMLGVAWPSIRDEFDQPNGALGVLTTCYGIGRLAMSATGGLQLRRRRFGRATAVAVGVLGLASVAVLAAPSWPVLVAAVLLTGLASGAIDALGGRLIATLRSVRSAGLLAGSYGVGATVGPALVALGDRWRLAYGVAAAVAVIAAAFVVRPGLSWPAGMGGREDERCGDTATARAEYDQPLWTSPAVIASVLTMVCFVGVEVTVGSWAATFLEDARNVESWAAGLAVSGFWGGATIGRLALGAVAVEARHLRVLTLLVVAAAASLALLPGPTVIAGSVALGLALAPFFPVVMATTAQRVGVAAASQVSGWQLVFGNVGATSIPALTGVIVATSDEWAVLWVLFAVCGAGLVVLTWSERLVARRAAELDPR